MADAGFHYFVPDWIGFEFSDKPQPGYGFNYTEALQVQETKHRELTDFKEAFDGLTVEIESSINKLIGFKQALLLFSLHQAQLAECPNLKNLSSFLCFVVACSVDFLSSFLDFNDLFPQLSPMCKLANLHLIDS
ncbi:hypothetical protein Sjap_011527 [Stephania japonica]|uniref:Uncharacterized protein n=1 Tax=Stephania japonica TaxID=461633 RepID=A0AAP0JDK5_9MAGN